MQQVGEHDERRQQRRQVLFAMTVVMLETIALGLKRIIVFIFNLPPCATRGNHLRHVGVVNRQGRGKRISVQYLTVCCAGSGDLAPVCLLYTSPSPRDRTRSRM